MVLFSSVSPARTLAVNILAYQNIIVELSLERARVIKLQHILLILTKVTQCFLSIIVNFLACKTGIAFNTAKLTATGGICCLLLVGLCSERLCCNPKGAGALVPSAATAPQCARMRKLHHEAAWGNACLPDACSADCAFFRRCLFPPPFRRIHAGSFMASWQQTKPLADGRYLCNFSTLHRQGVNVDLRLGPLASAEPSFDGRPSAS